MQPYRASYGFPRASAGVSVTSFLKRVYLAFFASILATAGGGLAALYLGEPVAVARGVSLPPAIVFGIEHPFVMIAIYFGAFFAASFLRTKPGINMLALLGYGAVTGLFLAPAIFFAQVAAKTGGTLSPAPVRDAFLLSAAAFGGLTAYAFTTKRDFSFLGASLSIGLWVLIGASLIGIFVGSNVFHLAIASVGVVLFAGFILYDTWRIVRSGDESDPIGAALRLYLDFINLFISLLRILSSGRSQN